METNVTDLRDYFVKAKLAALEEKQVTDCIFLVGEDGEELEVNLVAIFRLFDFN
jgi:hypothetical protein